MTKPKKPAPFTGPATLQVGHVTYDIAYEPITELGCVGHHKGWLSRIVIDSDQSPGQVRSTLWHETLHALCYVFAPSRHDNLNVKSGTDVEESYVAVLEFAIPLFIRDNPEAFAWIMGDA